MPKYRHAGVDDAVRAIRRESNRREKEFLIGLFEDLDGVEGLDEMSLEELRTLYQDEQIYDEIWLGGSIEDDNSRHEADDYHEGFQQGLMFAVSALSDAGIQIPPL